MFVNATTLAGMSAAAQELAIIDSMSADLVADDMSRMGIDESLFVPPSTIPANSLPDLARRFRVNGRELAGTFLRIGPKDAEMSARIRQQTLHLEATIKLAKKGGAEAAKRLALALRDMPEIIRRKHVPGILRAARRHPMAVYAARLLIIKRPDLLPHRAPAVSPTPAQTSFLRNTKITLWFARSPISTKTSATPVEAKVLPNMSPLALLISEAVEGLGGKAQRVLLWAKEHPEIFGDAERAALKEAKSVFWWAEEALYSLNIG